LEGVRCKIKDGGTLMRIGMAVAALFLGPSLALADAVLSGEEAAYIDWSVNNCGTKSTDKEHTMIDQANAKDSVGFLRRYQSANLSEATSSPSKQEAMCADIKDKYGPAGSRIPGLITWQNAAAATPETSSTATTTGRKGRRRSNQ